MQTNIVYNADSILKLKEFPDESIDMVLTSPPYDNLRSYNNTNIQNNTIQESIIIELHRILKKGGVVVQVVNDSVKNGSESGTSFKQALFFKETGFNLHDTMIYAKKNPIPANLIHKRCQQSFEYMFVFSKGKLKTFNPIMEKCKTFGTKKSRANENKANERMSGVRCKNEITIVKEEKVISNIQYYALGLSKNFKHPAKFPDKLAYDHILMQSNEGDIILDPFAGSGTVGIIAKQLNRKYILIEKVSEYIDVINDGLGIK